MIEPNNNAEAMLCAAHARMVELEDEAKQYRDTLYAVRLALACDEAANGPMIATIDEALQALNACAGMAEYVYEVTDRALLNGEDE